MKKRLLLISFHFPPVQGSTGVLRTLGFCRYLREHHWEVTVLTANTRAHPETNPENLALIPEGTSFFRAFALDTQRHLAIRGRYFRSLALPDRWQSWIAGGLARGFALAKTMRPDVLMSTYPIASAHCIGLGLHKLTGIPWLAEFRDPMAQENYPSDPVTRKWYERIERAVFRNAGAVVTATAGAAQLYRERYPHYPGKVVDIQNGFDEEVFSSIRDSTPSTSTDPARKLTLLHSGLLYPHERNPEPFFRALSALMHRGDVQAQSVRFEFLGSGFDDRYEPLVRQLGLSEIVRFQPTVPYKKALEETMKADACLLFQGPTCNQQIPAKTYEYLYAQKPVYALTDASGDTAALLRSLGSQDVVDMNDTEAIMRHLPSYLERLRIGTVGIPDQAAVSRLSRRSGAATLALTLDELVRHRS